MMRGFRVEGDRDLVFVPLGVNYDRVLEDRTLLRSGEKQSTTHALAAMLRFLGRNLRLVLRGEWYRYGYACVNFGSPFSMREYCREHGVDFQRLTGEERKRAMSELGAALMQAVGRVVPVVPAALIATIFVRNAGRALSELELKAEAARLIAALEERGAHIYVPRGDRDYALAVGLRMLQLRKLVEEHDGLYQVRSHEKALVEYYANSIAHLF
jgi:glycerol-3-phosphate O-acyltransferase